MARFEDPNWPRASDWLSGRSLPSARHMLSVLGAPSRLGSISPGRSDLAPAAIRTALEMYSCYDIAVDADVRGLIARDLGDLAIADLTIEDSFDPIRAAVTSAVGGSAATVLLGGDNSITRPGVHGLGLPFNSVGVVTLDAHFDLRDTANGLNNGNPIRALLGDGLPGPNVVQIGIQSFANSGEYASVARAAGIRVIPMDKVHRDGLETVVAEELDRVSRRVQAIYVDLDLDVMDRSFALGAPGSRPGGLTPRDVVAAARSFGAHPLVRAIDFVELDPKRDSLGTTTMTAAMALLAFAAGVLVRVGGAGL